MKFTFSDIASDVLGLIVLALICITVGVGFGTNKTKNDIVAQCENSNTFLVTNEYQITCYTPEQIELRAREIVSQQQIADLEEAINRLLGR